MYESESVKIKDHASILSIFFRNLDALAISRVEKGQISHALDANDIRGHVFNALIASENTDDLIDKMKSIENQCKHDPDLVVLLSEFGLTAHFISSQQPTLEAKTEINKKAASAPEGSSSEQISNTISAAYNTVILNAMGYRNRQEAINVISYLAESKTEALMIHAMSGGNLSHIAQGIEALLGDIQVKNDGAMLIDPSSLRVLQDMQEGIAKVALRQRSTHLLSDDPMRYALYGGPASTDARHHKPKL